MKHAYTNGILLDGTEQMQPVAHKILLTEDDKIIAIVDEGVEPCWMYSRIRCTSG